MKWIVSVALVLACAPHSADAPKGEPAPPEPAHAAATATAPAAPAPAPGAPAEQSSAPAGPELPPAPVFAAGPFEVRMGKKRPVPPTKAFAAGRVLMDNQDHPWAFGWTTDGGAFAYCTIAGGATECRSCLFTRVDGTTETMGTGRHCDARRMTKLAKNQLEQRLADLGVVVRDGTWAHGGDLVVTTRKVMGAPDMHGDARGILKVGTARRDGSAEGDAYEEDACRKLPTGVMCFFEAHADLLMPSPDGTLVGIVGHMWAGEWSDEYTAAIVPAGRLAAASYNKQGLDALGRQDHAAAATAFLAATHADPEAWKGPYNLACAYARASDPRAEPAFKLAIARDGPAVRKRAATDRDLDGVRAQAWFTAAIAAPQ
jgi:hypothetical protein